MSDKENIQIRFGEYLIYSDRHNYILAEVKDGISGNIDLRRDLKMHSFFPTIPMLFEHLLNRRIKESDISSFDELRDSIIEIRALLEPVFQEAVAS